MKRLILLASAASYRTGDFERAAKRLGVEVVLGMDVPAPLAHTYGCPLPLDYLDLERSTQAILKFAQTNPVGAILSADDSATVLAAQASRALGLRHNDPEAAEAARDKYAMRRLFAAAGVASPRFAVCRLAEAPETISTQFEPDPSQMQPGPAESPPAAAALRYPVVLKPRFLSGSRGVIRANNPAEFVAAFNRIRPIIEKTGGEDVLVEAFIPGAEVALEGMLNAGVLRVLALFDKPDPLDGPLFEETIYVTPSRLPPATQSAIRECAARAAAALGLREGPVHAELRLAESGPVVVEVAGRSIGGLCSRTLRFGTDMSLEELILRQAFELKIDAAERQAQAGGVMMLPIPHGGMFLGCEGVDDALSVPGIEAIEITAKVNQPITPLPEGDSYLGFVFARGRSPGAVEAALRAAHGRLLFKIAPEIPVLAA